MGEWNFSKGRSASGWDLSTVESYLNIREHYDGDIIIPKRQERVLALGDAQSRYSGMNCTKPAKEASAEAHYTSGIPRAILPEGSEIMHLSLSLQLTPCAFQCSQQTKIPSKCPRRGWRVREAPEREDGVALSLEQRKKRKSPQGCSQQNKEGKEEFSKCLDSTHPALMLGSQCPNLAVLFCK